MWELELQWEIQSHTNTALFLWLKQYSRNGEEMFVLDLWMAAMYVQYLANENEENQS